MAIVTGINLVLNVHVKEQPLCIAVPPQAGRFKEIIDTEDQNIPAT